MSKNIKLTIKAKPPRNGHVASVMLRPGAGAHGKTKKAERRSWKIDFQRSLGTSPSGHGTSPDSAQQNDYDNHDGSCYFHESSLY